MRPKYNETEEYSNDQLMEMLIQIAKLLECLTHDVRQLTDALDTGGTISTQLVEFLPEDHGN